MILNSPSGVKCFVLYSRTFLSPSDDEAVPQGCVHGEDWTTVCLCHHSNQEMFPPNIHVSIYGSSKGQVVLERTNFDLAQVHNNIIFLF